MLQTTKGHSVEKVQLLLGFFAYMRYNNKLERGKMDWDKIEIVRIDSLVPEEHLLRKIDAAVDFSRVPKK